MLPNYISQLTDNGIGLDLEGYKANAIQYYLDERDSYLEELSELLGTDVDLKDKLHVVQTFQSNGIILESMTQEYLKKRQNERKEIFLLYKAKEYNQKLSTYSVDKLTAHMDSCGRIHAEWYEATETTGRLTCRAPALQGFPSRCRQFFKPDEGYCFVTVDYSTIEMRVLARLSGDKQLIKELQKGGDIHRDTASAIFKKPPEAVTPEERQMAKSVGFMITYGGSAPGLAQKLRNDGVNCTFAEAQNFIHSFYQKHPEVAYYHYQLKSGLVVPTTLMGRTFEGIRGSKALNYPVQASAAEGFKLTLSQIVEQMPSEYRLVMAIHDSISLEVPAAAKQEAENFLKLSAESIMGQFLSPVPVFVEVKYSI